MNEIVNESVIGDHIQQIPMNLWNSYDITNQNTVSVSFNLD